MVDTTTEILEERSKTHGDFATNALISQTLKRLIRATDGYSALINVQREAIDMICLKLSRILSGQADFADHWADIEGYARLARNAP